MIKNKVPGKKFVEKGDILIGRIYDEKNIIRKTHQDFGKQAKSF